MDYLKANPDSARNVVSTMGPVYSALLKALKDEIPDLHHVFSPTDLSYETVMRLMRDERNRVNASSSDVYPLFAFNRQPLLPNDTLGRRVSQAKISVDDDSDDTIKGIYYSAFGYVESDFYFYTRDMDALMRFEIAYVSQTGISGIRHVEVDLPDIGVQEYSITWENLNNLEISGENNSYLCVAGRFKIDGNFLVFEGTDKIIKEIQAATKSVFNSEPALAETVEQLSSSIISD